MGPRSRGNSGRERDVASQMTARILFRSLLPTAFEDVGVFS